MNYADWIAVGAAAVTGLLSPYFLLPLLRKWSVVDAPSARSSHDRVTVRGAGLTSLLAVGLGLGIAMINTSSTLEWQLLLTIVITAAAAAALGFAEDVTGIPVAARLVGQVLVGVGAALALTTITGASYWWVVLITPAIAGYINVANFMDGLNGLSSLYGLTAGVAFAIIGTVGGQEWLVVTGLIVAVVFASFLPWNLRPPGAFLGDVGSYLLGSIVATIAGGAALSGVPVVVVLGPLAVYLADTLATIVRRAFRGEPILKAHRSHTYQVLTTTGLGHLQVAAIVAVFTLITSSIGLLGFLDGVLPPLAALAGIAVVVTLYLALPSLRLRMKVSTGERLVSVPVETLPSRANATRWVVVGGSGFIGSALVDHVSASTMVPVRAPRLLLPSDTDVGEVVNQARAEAASIEGLARSFVGADVVINAAGLATPDARKSPELYGANALLPVVIAAAAERAGVTRMVHLSSAAVQGRSKVLDESTKLRPFSAYSRSKALGESALASYVSDGLQRSQTGIELRIVRATSVQGIGRARTDSFSRIANSPLSSVAAPGDQPTVVSSLEGLVAFVERVASDADPRVIRLQPWEGGSVSSVLMDASNRTPTVLPRLLCHIVVASGYLLGIASPRVRGLTRRLELMWFGQQQLVTETSDRTDCSHSSESPAVDPRSERQA